MSHGPGVIESAILEALTERSQIYAPELSWIVAEKLGALAKTKADVGDLSCKELTLSTYGATRRAVRSLLEKKKIERAPLIKPRLFDDVIAAYPSLTKSGAIREMRTRLFPHVKTFLDENEPLYDEPDTEEKLVAEARAAGMQSYTDACSRWQDRVLPAMKAALVDPLLDEDATTHVIATMSRGTQLLSSGVFRSRTSSPESLSALARRCPAPASPAVMAAWRELALLNKEFFGTVDLAHATFKGHLYAAVDFKSSGTPRLKSAAADFLRKQAPDLVCSLPGHFEPKPPPPGRKSLGDIGWEEKRRYSPLLTHKLIERQVLRPIEILRRPGLFAGQYATEGARAS